MTVETIHVNLTYSILRDKACTSIRVQHSLCPDRLTEKGSLGGTDTMEATEQGIIRGLTAQRGICHASE